MDDELYNTLMVARSALVERLVKTEDAINRIDSYMAAAPATDPVERILAMMRAMPDRRDLYETQGGEWYVTYSGDERPYAGLTREQVADLEARGLIELIYTGAYKLTGTKRHDAKGREIVSPR
jgi:hypothetical protein